MCFQLPLFQSLLLVPCFQICCFQFPASFFQVFASLLSNSLLSVRCFQFPASSFAASISILPGSCFYVAPCFASPAFQVQFRQLQFHASSFQFLLPGPCLVLASSLLFNSTLQSAASSSQAQFLVSSPLLLVLCLQIFTFRSLLPGPGPPCFQLCFEVLAWLLVPCFYSRLQFPVFSSTIEVIYNVLLWNRWKRKGKRHFLKRLHNLRLVSQTNSAKHQKGRLDRSARSHVRRAEWMDGWLDGWMDGWVHGWVWAGGGRVGGVSGWAWVGWVGWVGGR